jgi:hypothetical protein
VTAALLASAFAEVRSRARTAGADVHHGTVREFARTTIPFSFGDWLGSDVAADPGVLAILRPNAIVHREYRNLRTEERVTLLFVQCSDARDLLGHFPPICYPAHGLIPGPALAREWTVQDLAIPSMRYAFHENDLGSRASIVVDNFMVLPTGRVGRDMESVDRVAQDPRRRGFGAAQFQIVTPASMSDARRDQVFRELVERNLPLLRALLSDSRMTHDDAR